MVSAEPVDQTVGMIDTNYLLSGHRLHSEDKGRVAKQWAFLQIGKNSQMMLLFSDIADIFTLYASRHQWLRK